MSEKSPGHRPKTHKASDREGRLTVSQRRTARRARKQGDPSKTGRLLRQTFPTPSVSELLARQQGHVVPINGGDLPIDAPADPTGVFDRKASRFHEDAVDEVIELIRATKFATTLTERYDQAKQADGRRQEVSIEALAVGLLLNAEDGRGSLLSAVADTLYYRLRPSSMRRLGLRPLEKPPAGMTRNSIELQRFHRLQRDRVELRVRRAFHRALSIVDPSVHPKGIAMSWTQLRDRDKKLTPEQVEERMDLLATVCNDILRIPFNMLPAGIRKHAGSLGIDATPIRSHARGRSVDSEEASVDPDAGYYVREGDHDEDSAIKTTKTRFFGYDLHNMVSACAVPGERQYIPALPVAMHLTRPGVDPAGAFRRMATNLAAVGWQPKYLAGDGLYARADTEGFHLAARSLGYELVLPVLDESLGVQGSVAGYLIVEGGLCCPSMPQHLIDATKDLRDGTIDLDRYRELIEERRRVYGVKLRSRDPKNPNKIRIGCPASGKTPVIACANKPDSVAKDNITFISGGKIRIREQIFPKPELKMNDTLPQACRADTVTIDLAEHPVLAKFWQDIQFGTDEHTDTYNSLRQSTEGWHGFAKDDAHNALATPGRRRVHGLAAQYIFTAFLLAAAGIRKVRQFFANAHQDENGDLYVKRRTRKGQHGPTHMPPGTETRGGPRREDDDRIA